MPDSRSTAPRSDPRLACHCLPRGRRSSCPRQYPPSRDEWRRGETCLAQIHLARSGLPGLPDREEASFRFFLGDNLIAGGVCPARTVQACGIDPAALGLFKRLRPKPAARSRGKSRGWEWTTPSLPGYERPERSRGPVDQLHAGARVATRRCRGDAASWEAHPRQGFKNKVLDGAAPRRFLSSLCSWPGDRIIAAVSAISTCRCRHWARRQI